VFPLVGACSAAAKEEKKEKVDLHQAAEVKPSKGCC
jgi:hypothetical protein